MIDVRCKMLTKHLAAKHIKAADAKDDIHSRIIITLKDSENTEK